MKRIAFSVLIVALVQMAACQTSRGTEPVVSISGPDDIRDVMDEQVKAWNRGDLEGFMAGYHQSNHLRFASNNSVTYGWIETLENYKKAFPDKSKTGHLKFSSLNIKMLSPESAVVFGRFTQSPVDADRSATGLFTLIFKKFDAGWRIIHDHSSDARERK